MAHDTNGTSDRRSTASSDRRRRHDLRGVLEARVATHIRLLAVRAAGLPRAERIRTGVRWEEILAELRLLRELHASAGTDEPGTSLPEREGEVGPPPR